ncbi:MAG: Glutathione import ATP-binding protein GsiA [Burkholderiaceae bacterium]|nr:Glutathione import ATP-binding protein GsiA [Burkholderiaceae bacterium]
MSQAHASREADGGGAYAPLLELSHLTIHLRSDDAEVALVRELSLAVESGETLCLVGESGSGKSVTAMSIIRLLEFTAPVRCSGSIALAGTDLTGLSAQQMRGYRGSRIGMIFQEALDSLNPSQRIATQLVEAYRPAGASLDELLGTARRSQALQRARSLLTEVGLPDTERILSLYPHQLSGGMQQRVMIALALMSNPQLLIADEPTTALDVTTQAEILKMFRRVQRDHKTACVFITHDMAVAAEIADRIAVVYAGRLVEVGPTHRVLASPGHRYTRALLECVPRIGVRQTDGLPSIRGAVPSPADAIPGCRFAPRCGFAVERCHTVEPALAPHGDGAVRIACWNPGTGAVGLAQASAGLSTPAAGHERSPILVVDRVSKVFQSTSGSLRRYSVRAVDEVSLALRRGEFFGLVGESGSGKTTLGRIVTALERPSAGRITLGSHSFGAGGLSGRDREFRRLVQPVFQDPLASLDPRYTVADIVAEPLRELTALRGRDLAQRVATLIAEVGLPSSLLGRRPSQLSGGQRQRVAIARAIAPEPALIVADEPTSALDVSVQGQVINLLLELRRARNLSILFITHNLSLILSVADRIGVMQTGRLIEVGSPETITRNPAHDYTRTLLRANPVLPDYAGGSPPHAENPHPAQ